MRLNTLKKEYKRVSEKTKKQVDKDLAFQIGLQIENLRISKGLTQSRLASRVKTKQPSIARIESGEKLPSLSFLERIAKALEVDIVFNLLDSGEEQLLETKTQSHKHIQTPYVVVSRNSLNKTSPHSKITTIKLKTIR